jgi:hypothetical protein
MLALSSHGLSEVEEVESELTEIEKIKKREEDELYEFLYSVQNYTFNHIR